MPGSWSRVKVWSSGEILTAADLNAEFNNVITNDVPTASDDYMASNVQAQLQTDPYPSSVLSLATSLASELERYRYQIAQITGNTYWYEDPPTDLRTVSESQSLGLAVGLEFEGPLGGASSTTDVFAKIINQGAIINALSWSTADLTINEMSSTQKKFGSYSLALGGISILGFPGYYNNPVKGTLSAWFRNLASGDYIAYNPLTGTELYLDSSGFLTFKQTEKTAASESAKNATTVAGSVSRAGDTTFRHVAAKWRLNDENGAGTDLLELEYGASDEGTQVGSDNIDINPGRGGIWFIGNKRNDPTWDHSYAVNGLPTAHSDAWTKTGAFTATVSNGVLTMNATGATGQQTYSKTNNIDLDGMTIDWKMKVNSVSAREALAEDRLVMVVNDDSKNRGVTIAFDTNSISISNLGSGLSDRANVIELNVDTTSYHRYRLTSVASGSDITCKFYIDGVIQVSWTNTLAASVAGDVISLGGYDGGTYSYSIAVEDFRYESNGSTVYPPVAPSSQGHIDSFGIVSNVVSDAVISRLQTSKVSDVFGRLPSYGITLPYNIIPSRDAAAHSTTSTTFTTLSTMQYFVPGDGITPVRADGLFTISGANNTNIQIGIDVNGDLTGSDSYAYGVAHHLTAAADKFISVSPFRTCILPVQLNTISVKWRVSANNANLEEINSVFELSIPKQVVLP